jgi:hypothetical protein
MLRSSLDCGWFWGGEDLLHALRCEQLPGVQSVSDHNSMSGDYRAALSFVPFIRFPIQRHIHRWAHSALSETETHTDASQTLGKATTVGEADEAPNTG